VYETNTASTKIWDSLGFKRIGRVPGCGVLKSFSEPIDAIIYGRDLKAEGENIGNEERFDKIRYYLRHSSYPQGADRSEKSRLRSAATHYKLIPAENGDAEKLMLKDKEVISDPTAQYEIAKQIHNQSHGGINKTTAVIATQYHWVRIKETVSHVIKNCPECKDSSKATTLRVDTKAIRPRSADEQIQTPTLQQSPADRTPITDIANHNHNHLRNEQLRHDHMQDFTTLSPHIPTDGTHDMHGHETDLAYDDTMEDMNLDPSHLDPQIMEQILESQQMGEDGFPQHHQFMPSGLADYSDLHLQHPQDPHGYGGQAPEQYIHNPGQTIMTHDMMDDGSGNTGLNNMQGMQHVLHMNYLNSDGTDYKQ
jgi:hypothetical protein